MSYSQYQIVPTAVASSDQYGFFSCCQACFWQLRKSLLTSIPVLCSALDRPTSCCPAERLTSVSESRWAAGCLQPRRSSSSSSPAASAVPTALRWSTNSILSTTWTTEVRLWGLGIWETYVDISSKNEKWILCNSHYLFGWKWGKVFLTSIMFQIECFYPCQYFAEKIMHLKRLFS